jgi:hypothetical protein
MLLEIDTPWSLIEDSVTLSELNALSNIDAPSE